MSTLRLYLLPGYDVAHVCRKCQGGVQPFPHDIPICDTPRIRDAIGDSGVVLLHGGGNWGNLYLNVQQCRKAHMSELAAAGIRNFIGMPQSMCYGAETIDQDLLADEADLDMLRKAGVNVKLYWRQLDSYEHASGAIISAEHVMTPDVAWAIGPLFRNTPASVDIVLLLRRDGETTPGFKDIVNAIKPMLADSEVTYTIIDWKDLPTIPEAHPRMAAPNAYMFAEAAAYAANTILSQGRVVVTNRLHATILATLMHMPVFYADNTYGKIKATRAASLTHPHCTADNLLAWQHTSVTEAVQAAIKYVKK